MSVKKKPRPSQSLQDSEEDDEAVQSHLSELVKELKKRQYADEKIVRLLSLTFSVRRTEMLTQSANSRISSLLQKFKCLN